MALFLVTGLPGTGKSTICAELKARGFTAYDGDYDHLAYWYNDATGEPILGNHERTIEFLDSHSRDIKSETIRKIVANDKPIFVCADPENEDELVPLFDRIFALVLDEEMRQTRLASRTNNQWGKLPHEVAYDLAIKPRSYARYEKFGYIKIDASQTPEDIVTIIATLIR
jgi:broad-specificity NMP kinase